MVVRNIFERTGYRELGVSLGYNYLSKVYTSMDHLLLFVNDRPRYDIVFAGHFWIADNFSLRGSLRLTSLIGVDLDTAMGFGLSYHAESVRVDFGTFGYDIHRMAYGISIVKGN